MTELRHIGECEGDVFTHVVFLHGLSGHIEKTWTNAVSPSPILWPKWLGEDIDGIELWLVGYPSAATNWFSYSSPLPTRADSILARLLSESDLSDGNIAFIAHSFGGLVVQQVLRNADRDARSNNRARDFLSRVRRVAFLGTPQKGSVLASVARAFRWITRASPATHDLVRNNPYLTDLTHWYRRYSSDNGIENLVLAEGRPKRVFGLPLPRNIGTVVPPPFTDIGQHSIPIVIDEDHNRICKPHSRSSEVYTNLREFLRRPYSAPHQALAHTIGVSRHTLPLEEIPSQIKEIGHPVTDPAGKHHPVGIQNTHSTIVNEEVTRRLERIRKCCLFRGFDTTDETRGLVSALQYGELVSASDSEKSIALAWCARLLSRIEPAEAESILQLIASPHSELYRIAKGCITGGMGNSKSVSANSMRWVHQKHTELHSSTC